MMRFRFAWHDEGRHLFYFLNACQDDLRELETWIEDNASGNGQAAFYSPQKIVVRLMDDLDATAFKLVWS